MPGAGFIVTFLMSGGSLDRRVIIQSRDDGVDAIGQPVDTWTALITVWASRRFSSGLESIKAGSDTSITRASYRIRFSSEAKDINAGMRLYDDGEIWDIESVMQDRSYGKIDLVCKRVS